jgi:hypothetical protein
MPKELSVYERMTDPLAAVEQLGNAIAQSAMFGCSNPSQGKVLAMACLVDGKSPIEIARKYHIIEGNLSKKADAMLAEFRERGGKQKMVCRTPEKAEIELAIDGEMQLFSLTWTEAQQEPFVFTKKRTIKKNWATPRSRMQMLWARVVSDGVRVMCPEVVAGTCTPEEIADFDQPRTASQAAVVDAEVVHAAPALAQGVQSLSAPAGPTAMSVNSRCRPDQLDEVYRLWGPAGLQRSNEQLRELVVSAGKENERQLTVADADSLIARLKTLLTEAQADKLFTPAATQSPGQR